MYLEELINKNYHQLNDNVRYIWNYISLHRKECENISIDDLAEKCHVSRTTILRFSKRLGLKGYTELKVFLRIDNSKSHDEDAGINNIYQSCLRYMKSIKEQDMSHTIELLMNAKNIYAYGTGSIQNHVISEMKRTFLDVGKLIFTIKSMSETQVYEEVMTPEDVIIIVSYSGENKKMLEFVKKAKLRNISIIAITTQTTNSLFQIADESLYVEPTNILNPAGSRYECLVNYFILIDFIFAKYIAQYERKFNQNVK